MGLDDIDRRILRQVQRDATLSLDALAERVGLSRNACWRRLRSLETEGIIARRVALVDPQKVDLGLIAIMLIRTSRHEPDWLDRFARATRDMPEIQSAYRMSGDLDYLIRARVADVAAYDALYRRLIAKVEMSDVSTSFVMEELKETTELPL